jgi:hypothetical protein
MTSPNDEEDNQLKMTTTKLPGKETTISGKSNLSQETKPDITLIPSKVVLPQKVSLSPITKDNIAFFKRLISIILPVSYSDSFYTSVLTIPSSSVLTLLAYWSDTPNSSPGRLVSAISGKLITDPEDTRMSLAHSTDQPANTVYISTLATLSPYRGHGIAGALLRGK